MIIIYRKERMVSFIFMSSEDRGVSTRPGKSRFTRMVTKQHDRTLIRLSFARGNHGQTGY